ncbi:MAG TPA: hypothetical protein PL033_06305 [Candidatus Brocadiia bacterium]|nr:hypothetical protein [Candidatus Brocadiia bacterium]
MEGPLQYVILFFAFTTGVTVMGLIFKALFREDTPRCYKCRMRMTPLADLDEAEQNRVMEYYATHEGSNPSKGSIWCCQSCRIVYGEFADKTKSSTGAFASVCKVCNNRFVEPLADAHDTGEIQRFRQAYPESVDLYECLRCRREPPDAYYCDQVCDADPKPYGCRKCGTLYVWKSPEGHTYRFMHALTDSPLLKKPDADL